MTNLWEETIEYLTQKGKTFDDVHFIQGATFQITKENFEQVAKHSNYNSGYGAAHVPVDLVLVGDGWWLEREEYDGAEWWVFKELPQQLVVTREVQHLVGGAWPNLAKSNDLE